MPFHCPSPSHSGWENVHTPSTGTGSATQNTSAARQSSRNQLGGVAIMETRAHSTSYGPRNDEDLELNDVSSPTSPGFSIASKRGLRPWDRNNEKADYFEPSGLNTFPPTPLTPTFSFNRVQRDRDRTMSNNSSVPFSGPGFTEVPSELSPNGDLMSPSTMVGDFSPQKSEFGSDV